MTQVSGNPLKQTKGLGFAQGIGLTLVIAMASKYLADFPFLNIMGQLVIAILLGIAWRTVIGVPDRAMNGISFSSKKLLRYGIILLGMRLNLVDIVHAGPRVLADCGYQHYIYNLCRLRHYETF